MTKEQITAGNKRMAEYLGYKYYPHTAPYKGEVVGWVRAGLAPKNPLHRLCRSHRDLPFYNSWDALMMVVDKIEKNGVVVSIIKHSIAIHNYHEVYASVKGSTDKLKATWEVCLNYITKDDRQDVHTD
jgi:hypothetical protein